MITNEMLLLPLLEGRQLIIPKASLIDVAACKSLVPYSKTPDWILGVMSWGMAPWKQRKMPVFAVDAFFEKRPKIATTSKIAIVLAHSSHAIDRFYAILIQNEPLPITITKDMLMIATPGTNFVAFEIKLPDITAYIPDFEFLGKTFDND